MKIYKPTDEMKREFKALGIPFPAFPLTVDQAEYLFHLAHLHMPNQHPDVSPMEHHAKAVARAYAHKPRWKRLGKWERRLLTGALLLLAILFAVFSAHAQTTNSNITSVGGTRVDPAAGIPIFCISGCGGGTITANQGNAGASPWLVSGAVTVSWAAAQHMIIDSGTLGQLPAALDGSGFLKIHEQGAFSIANSFLLDATFTARIPALGQKAMSGSVPVVISSDQSSLAFDPQGPDSQAATQTGKPVQNGGLNYSDGKIYTLGVDSSGRQQMAIVGTVTLGNLPQQPFLNTTDFSDTVAGSPVLGDTFFANSTPKWTKLAGSTLSAGGGFYNETQATLAAPSAPVLTVSNTGGSGGNFAQASALTAYVTVTLVNAFGETTQSAESTIAIDIAHGCLAASTTCAVVVTAPTLTGNATGYTVYSDRDPGGEVQQTALSNCVNITTNCTFWNFGTGAAPPTINTASNGTLVVPTWKASTGSGNVVLANNAVLTPQSLGLTLYADQYPGADMCAKIQSAWLSLPSMGGSIDATGFQGSQACASEPFLATVDNANKPFDLALGVVTINSTVSWYVPSNFHIHGLGDMTVIAFQPAGGASETTKADLFHCNGCSNLEIDHIKFTGTANTGRILTLAQGSNYRVHHNTISGASYVPVAGPAAPVYIEGASDVWFENNVLTNNGPGPGYAGSSTNSDIVTWTATVQNRIHIRNNQISGSHEEASISMFDCLDCDIIGNSIDQNNTITTTLTKGGYGITVYGVNTRPRNVRVEGNHVANCAGSCIYLNNNDHAIIDGNSTLTCAQQESDVSLPVGCISTNDCANCVISSNTIKTSTKDGIDAVQPGLGLVISNNTIQTITQYGINLRTVTDATVIGNYIQSSTLDWIHDTGARNHIIGNHVLTSGAATTVASDVVVNNVIDAGGAVGRGNDLNLMVTGSNFVTAANTNLQTITGLSFTFPALLALNASVDCDLTYSQQTAAVADAFGFQDATVAPTNLEASGFVQTAITTWVDSTLTASATTTATNIIAMTPSAITTIWHAKLHIGIEQPSNASTSLFSVMVKTGTSADTVTVFRGSSCQVHFQ